METDPEAAFGKVLVERGLVRPEHVSECLRLRREMAGRGDGPVPGLGVLLIEKGYIATPKGRWTFSLPALLATIVLACVLAVLVFGRIRDRQEARRLATEQQARALLETARLELQRREVRLHVPNALTTEREHEDIERPLRDALALSPRLADAHCLRARLLELRDLRWQAERAWRDAIAVDPSCASAQLGLALCLLEQLSLVGETPHTEGMRREAERALATAARGTLADDIDQTCAEAASAFVAGNLPLARSVAARGIERAGRDERSARLFWLATCVEAASFDHAIARCPSYALLYACRARALTGADALRNLDTALVINPRFPEAHWMAGRARRMLHRARAVEHYREALLRSPPDWRFRAMVERELAELDQ